MVFGTLERLQAMHLPVIEKFCAAIFSAECPSSSLVLLIFLEQNNCSTNISNVSLRLYQRHLEILWYWLLTHRSSVGSSLGFNLFHLSPYFLPISTWLCITLSLMKFLKVNYFYWDHTISCCIDCLGLRGTHKTSKQAEVKAVTGEVKKILKDSDDRSHPSTNRVWLTMTNINLLILQ